MSPKGSVSISHCTIVKCEISFWASHWSMGSLRASTVTVWINCRLSPVWCTQLNLTQLPIDCDCDCDCSHHRATKILFLSFEKYQKYLKNLGWNINSPNNNTPMSTGLLSYDLSKRFHAYTVWALKLKLWPDIPAGVNLKSQIILTLHDCFK